MERLSKILAKAGVASRRGAENLIVAGKVKVNGETITVLGHKVTEKDIITVNGQKIEKEPLVYFLVNKPTSYLSATADKLKSRSIMELLNKEDQAYRLFPVHKLEYDTAGVLLLTNDGALTKKLTSPSFEIQKEYVIRLKGIMFKERLREIKRGIEVDGQVIKPLDIGIMELDKKNQSTLVQLIVINETAKQLKALFKKMGHPVKNMTRIRFDELTLEGVARGAYRKLKAHEVKYLHRMS